MYEEDTDNWTVSWEREATAYRIKTDADKLFLAFRSLRNEEDSELFRL